MKYTETIYSLLNWETVKVLTPYHNSVDDTDGNSIYHLITRVPGGWLVQRDNQTPVFVKAELWDNLMSIYYKIKNR